MILAASMGPMPKISVRVVPEASTSASIPSFRFAIFRSSVLMSRRISAPPRMGRGHSWGLETAHGGEGTPFDYLARHATRDWGELCAFDRRQNEIALRDGLRVLSSYDASTGSIWIITEADRSITTILLPGEY